MKRTFLCKMVIGVALLCFPAMASSQETYRFERMWPTLKQPWYFFKPSSIATDSLGNIYLTDWGRHRVLKFSQDGSLITSWGSYGDGNLEFREPRGIATYEEVIDDALYIYVYVVDAGNDRIQKFTADGTPIWQQNISSGWLSRITLDSEGYIYVTDHDNNFVMKLSEGINTLTIIDTWGNSGDFNEPYGIAVDAQGYIYVADKENDRIQRINQTNDEISSWYGYGLEQGVFDKPFGITIDAGQNIYVTNNGNGLIQKFSPDGTIFSWSFGGTPDDIALIPEGYIYVTEWTDDIEDGLNYNRIVRFSPDGTLLSSWTSEGEATGEFKGPYGIAAHEEGVEEYVYIADAYNKRIQKCTTEGNCNVLLGSPDWHFHYPFGIAADDTGNIYIADRWNQRIVKISPGGSSSEWSLKDTFHFPYGVAVKPNSPFIYVTAIQGSIFYNVLELDTTSGSYRIWGPPYSFNQPLGITVDKDGNVYVADQGRDLIHKCSPDETCTPCGSGLLAQPRGVAVDDAFNIYVADTGHNCVKIFDQDCTPLPPLEGLGGLGGMPGQMSYPTNLAVGRDGTIYVSDTGNNRIQVFRKYETPLNPKAVIVAGGGPYPGNNLWDATQAAANFAYRTLIHRGFQKDDIFYLSSNTTLDFEGDGFSEVNDIPTVEKLQDAITQWAVNGEADSLVVYLNDHGGPDTFRLHEGVDGILSSTDLALWLDDFQSSTSSRVTLIYEACESGSFINDLEGNDRIIITSTLPGEQAKFLSQGTISFSNFFWSNIFNGLGIEESFTGASQAVNFNFSAQTPQLEGDPGQLFIGNGVSGMLGDAPDIGEISPSREIHVENSSVIYADTVTDPEGIARVWAVIWPPDYDPGPAYTPLLDLPTLELLPAGEEGRYEGTYSEFNEVGVYRIAVYAMDRVGNISLPRFTTASKSVNRRAVIVAGGTGAGITRQMIEYNARLAYNTLISQHYSNDDIYFMSVTTFLEDIITYLPSIDNFEVHLDNLAGDESIANLDLTIYLIGGSEDGNFILNDDPDGYETLSASQLDEWLEALQAVKSGRITVICDFDRSGSFIRQHTLSEGSQRITIASTGDESSAYFHTAGNISFSSFLWDQLAAGAFLKDAFIYARKAIAYGSLPNDISFSCYMPQIPLIDTNSNGTPNESTDYDLVEGLKIGDGIVTADDPPQIGSASVVRDGEMITITAEDISSTSTVERVWAMVNPLLYCPGTSEGIPQVVAEIDLLGPDEEGRYTNTYPANYACKVTVYAMSYGTEGEPNISLPFQTRIHQEGGDIYEPDNDASEANVIVVNYPTAQPHTFHGRDDEDWVKFYGLEKDDNYTIEASNLGDNCPVIEVYDADDLTTPIAVQTDPAVDDKVWIVFRCTKDGIYHVRVVWGGCEWMEDKMHYDLRVYDNNIGLTAIVRGKVRDRVTGRGIDGAVIRSSGVGVTISTHGEYLLSEIPGSWTIRARKSGYTGAIVGIRIDSHDQQIRKDLSMSPQSKRCSEDADCDDGEYCNGVEVCTNGGCQSGVDPCGDDGLYCNGEEVGCDEENDMCEHSVSPCPGHQACVEESDECMDKECAGNEDCDDGRFCNGVEVCINDLCQAGIYPCADPTPACDEEEDICIEGPGIQLIPNPCLQSRWMPMLLFLRIVGTNTNFDISSLVTFDPPGAVMALPILGDSTHIFMIGLVMPSWLSPAESIEVTVATGAEVVSETLTLDFLPFMMAE